MAKDEIDEIEDEVHQTLDGLNLDPDLIETMRALWLQLLEHGEAEATAALKF
jgi:hypothetical protein